MKKSKIALLLIAILIGCVTADDNIPSSQETQLGNRSKTVPMVEEQPSNLSKKSSDWSPKEGFSVYYNPSYNILFEFPEEWLFHEESEGDVIYLTPPDPNSEAFLGLFIDDADSIEYFSEYVTIWEEIFGEQNEREVCASFGGSEPFCFHEDVERTKVVDSQETSLGENKGLKLILQREVKVELGNQLEDWNEKPGIKGLVFNTEKWGKSYTFYYYENSTKYNKYFRIVEEIIASAKIINYSDRPQGFEFEDFSENIELKYDKEVAFYVEGLIKGFGDSVVIEREKIEDKSDVEVCLDVNLDEMCDVFYEISPEDLFYNKIILTGDYECYGEHIRTDLVSEYLWRVPKINSSESANVDAISDWLRDYLNYKKDSLNFGSDNYWAPPNETLYKRKGDCEDWTSVYLSIIENLYPETKCYGVYGGVPSGHVFVVCKFDNRHTIYDQGFKESKFGSSRWLFRDYAMLWGVEEITIFQVFNSTSCYSFRNNEEFVEWMDSI